MAYKANIPLATDKKSVSQGDILGNFTAINSFIEVNHEPFASGDRGKHIKIDLTKLGANPSTAADELAVFNVDNELKFREPSDGTIWNLTPDITGHVVSGFEQLPSGLIVKWGTGSADGSTVTAFPLGVGIPVFASIYQVMISTNGNGGLGQHDFMAYLTAKTTANMTVYGSARTVNATRNGTFTYIAIGK